jgi:hypothetical protein
MGPPRPGGRVSRGPQEVPKGSAFRGLRYDILSPKLLKLIGFQV